MVPHRRQRPPRDSDSRPAEVVGPLEFGAMARPVACTAIFAGPQGLDAASATLSLIEPKITLTEFIDWGYAAAGDAPQSMGRHPGVAGV